MLVNSSGGILKMYIHWCT